MRRTTAVLICLSAAALVPCVGCGSAAETSVATVPVKGKVTYKGQPLVRGNVGFEPDGPGREAHGEVQPDGTFELSTYRPGDGAVLGGHRVSIVGATTKSGKNNVPLKYKGYASSKIETEVSADKTEYTFDLK